MFHRTVYTVPSEISSSTTLASRPYSTMSCEMNCTSKETLVPAGALMARLILVYTKGSPVSSCAMYWLPFTGYTVLP
jgi:hypothetical protein